MLLMDGHLLTQTTIVLLQKSGSLVGLVRDEGANDFFWYFTEGVDEFLKNLELIIDIDLPKDPAFRVRPFDLIAPEFFDPEIDVQMALLFSAIQSSRVNLEIGKP